MTLPHPFDARRLAAALLLALTAAGPRLAVHDGDTVRLGRERMRLDGIDAPEVQGSPACQPGARGHHDCDFAAGERSRAALVAILARGPVTIERVGDGGYGRTAVRLSVAGEDVSCTMWRAGVAAPPHDTRRYGWPCRRAR